MFTHSLRSTIVLPNLQKMARAPRYTKTFAAITLSVSALLSGCGTQARNCILDPTGDSSALDSQCREDAVATANESQQNANLLSWFTMYHIISGSSEQKLSTNQRNELMTSWGELSDQQRTGIRLSYAQMPPEDKQELESIATDALENSEASLESSAQSTSNISWVVVRPPYIFPHYLYSSAHKRSDTASRFARSYPSARPSHIASLRSVARANASHGGFGSRGGGVGGGR